MVEMKSIFAPFYHLITFTLITFGSDGLVAQSPKSPPMKMVVLGDSLSEGFGVNKEAAFPALLEKKLHAAGKTQWQVINAGVSGATSASSMGRLKWLIKSKPNVVLLALGANDGLRGLKVEETEKNLSEAIAYAQSQKIRVILAGLYMPPNYGKDFTVKFKQMYANLAKKYKLSFIPFILDQVAGNPKYNLPDGIHPNEEGHKLIAENIFKVVVGAL